MKKSVLFLLCVFLLSSVPSGAQGLLKKVTGAIKDELLNVKKTGNDASTEPEPACACDQAELIVSLAGTLKLDYKEINISTLDDGSILLQDRMSGNYYIIKEAFCLEDFSFNALETFETVLISIMYCFIQLGD